MGIKKSYLLWIFLWVSPHGFASHSIGGVDMCALYPEVMPPGLPAELLPQANGRGAQLMQTYCTQCHELPGPGRHTADEWKYVLPHMLTLMDVANRFAGLMGNVKTPDNDEREQLNLYLTRYALKPLQKMPAGLGGRAFENHCNGCHALPDPLQYDYEGWPALLKRMQRNMQVMKYTPPSSEVMLQIQYYLQSANTGDADLSQNVNNIDAVENKPQQNRSVIHPESWLALGPFILLVMIGLFRWWRKSHKTI